MATAPLHAAFPAGPVVDADGGLTPAWRGFFQSLYVRTGGAAGMSSDTTGLQADLDAEAAARGGGDTALTTAIANERAARQNADNLEATTRASEDARLLPLAGGIVTGPLRVQGGLGVLGQPAVTARPVVTGSKAGNAALGSLLLALVRYGFVTDTST